MIRIVGVVLTAAILSGCSAQTVKVDDGSAIATDATKRLVVVGKNEKGRVICAEPSPDAVASAALQAAAKANIPQANVNAELSSSYARAVASIGLRSASIQILRDLGYRACEGVANGVIKEETYHEIVEHLGTTTLSLIAIEGLTQMHPAPLVVVSPQGTASTTTSGTTATTGPTTINVQDVLKDYKPEELKNVADSVVKILEAYYATEIQLKNKVATTNEHAEATK